METTNTTWTKGQALEDSLNGCEMLRDLFEFQQREETSYSANFWLADIEDPERVYLDISNIPFAYNLENKTIPFAIADNEDDDDNRGYYAFLLVDESKPLEQLPVIYLHRFVRTAYVVASDFKEFLSLIALNIDDSPYLVWFYSKKATRNDEFRKWLKEKYNIEPAKDPKEIIDRNLELFDLKKILKPDKKPDFKNLK